MRLHNLTLPLTASHPHAPAASLLRHNTLFLVKASRPGFWLTAIWFYLLPFNGAPPLHSPAFWLGLLYAGLPLGMLIYAINDLTDGPTDRLNPRKDSLLFGARPTPPQIARLPSQIALIQLPFLFAFSLIIGPRALLWFAGVLTATTFYNLWAKSRPVFDTLAQAGYLMVFLLAIWLNDIPTPPPNFWLFGALFAMHSHLFGEIMDIEPDATAGRRTTAVAVGAPATKAAISLLLAIEAILVKAIPSKPWLPAMLALGALLFVLDALLWRARPYPPRLISLFFIGWNLFLLAEIVLSYLLSHPHNGFG